MSRKPRTSDGSASSGSSTTSCTSSLSDVPDNDFHNAVGDVISDEENSTTSLTKEARSILEWLEKEPDRFFAIPPDLVKDADIRRILVAMLEYSLELGDRAQRYAASSIVCCKQDVEALGKLANTWLGYFLLPCMSFLYPLLSITYNYLSCGKQSHEAERNFRACHPYRR